MYLQSNDCVLDPNNVFQVQKVVLKLYELFKEIPKPQTIKPLYLLATRNNQYTLVDSTSLPLYIYIYII